MGCQRNIAKKIIARKADYILALKGNQGTLHEDVELFANEQKANGFKDTTISRHETIDGDHGRIETRTYRSAPLAPLQPSPPRKDTCEGAFWRGFGGWSMPHILESPGGSQAAKPRLDVSGATITAGSSNEIGAMTVRHYCSVVAQQLLIYKGIVSSEMVRRQILSVCEPRILGKGAGHDQDPLRNPRRNP
jgi:hypothetical protein